MIIATAGHVDHGKTTLLQAITGVNADRLPEEKKARHDHRSRLCLLAQPDGRVPGFIDVPVMKNFFQHAGGRGGIDHALLVVACDEV
ncbi:selenocysteinyl-tRNA-specific translation factor [Escherichia coli]|uniref:Selenocysteinyl-tRNA-specific translation factor n=1 Tax=Escherichia coli TaxID=562 RepID=A0A377BUA3_ECOLX|nr:selenocysteinyl-tRNA-specific translation factor [Escherichia coli]